MKIANFACNRLAAHGTGDRLRRASWETSVRLQPPPARAPRNHVCARWAGSTREPALAKLGVYILTEGDFRDHPKVADGASEFLR